MLEDLVSQGWVLKVEEDGISARFPTIETDPATDKERIRHQELIKRNEQLATPSVYRFIKRMELPREYNGRFVSIFNLMRDGRELADTLLIKGATPEAISPYIQILSRNDRCEHTGLLLGDVWRYFRHTWTNHYTSTPGRTMRILVRDRAAPFHPVIGIAALGSAIVQIRERDKWIGWQPQKLIEHLDRNPGQKWEIWLMRRLDEGIDSIYLDDLIEDGLYWPALWHEPTEDGIDKLRREARARREYHTRFARKSDFKNLKDYNDISVWIKRARTDLFRSKRCSALADLLIARRDLLPYLSPSSNLSPTSNLSSTLNLAGSHSAGSQSNGSHPTGPSQTGLAAALKDRTARRTIGTILRRAKADAVGTEIADLTVCGALPPYNSLIGGKLISMLALSPTVIREYHRRYCDYASQIASSLAGRPVKRRSNLVYVGTTSLYGSHSSQYNRLRLPGDVLGASDDIVFRKLGRSKTYGTSQFSNATVEALVKLTEESKTGARVNSIFGEGVNPKLRKIRDALSILGWPYDGLLRHHRSRLIYGVALVDNLLEYLLDMDQEPRYLFPVSSTNGSNATGICDTSGHGAVDRRDNADDDIKQIVGWWYERWMSKRIRSEKVLAAVRAHSTDVRPVRHGARVQLPTPDESAQQQHLFADSGKFTTPVTTHRS